MCHVFLSAVVVLPRQEWFDVLRMWLHQQAAGLRVLGLGLQCSWHVPLNVHVFWQTVARQCRSASAEAAGPSCSHLEQTASFWATKVLSNGYNSQQLLSVFNCSGS